jgi:hypothetical protein
MGVSNLPNIIEMREIIMASRKMMQREVTTTFVSVAMIEVVDGTPKMVTLPDEEFVGNVSLEHAQRQLNKKFGQPVTILELIADTKTYEMPLEDFIKRATVKEEQLSIEEA